MYVFVAGVLFAAMAAALWLSRRHRHNAWRALAGAGAPILASGAALSLLIFLLNGLMCGRFDFSPVPSPERDWTAGVSADICGFGDSFSSAVYLRRYHRVTIFHPFGGPERATIFTIGHDPRLLSLEWFGTHELIIHYPGDSRSPEELSCRSRWEDIQIRCMPFVPDYSKPVANLPPGKGRWW
jgi:hypothetical protein